MPYDNMMTKKFEIREGFSSITFNKESAKEIAGNISVNSSYTIKGTTVAFPLANHEPYPLKPEDYPLSGVPINDVPSKMLLESLSPKVLIEPRLFHLTGDNIDLIIVQQDHVRDYVSFNPNESHLKVDETYLNGRISVGNQKTTRDSLVIISSLEQLIRKQSKVQKDESKEAAYKAHLDSLSNSLSRR